MIYIASPYSDENPQIRAYRWQRVAIYAAHLIEEGYHAYSPICHSEGIRAHVPTLGPTFAFWRAVDLDFLSRCDSLHVLMLDGWEKSVGVSAEIDEARRLRIPVSYIPV
jgi:hypothetical protein